MSTSKKYLLALDLQLH